MNVSKIYVNSRDNRLKCNLDEKLIIRIITFLVIRNTILKYKFPLGFSL